MEAQQIEKEIQTSEGRLRDIRQQIDAEQKRLEKFGSKEAYYDALAKEKEALNNLEILKSKKRSQTMQEICDKEISPRIDSLRNSPMNEAKRIETVMEISLFSETIRKIKTNYIFFERTGEVLFETLDPQLQIIYGEKREEITTSLRRTSHDVMEVKDERMVLKNPGQSVVVALPYAKAISLQAEGKGQIISNEEPIFEERIREDKEPEVLASVRKMSLGNPIPGIDGKLSSQAEALQRRCLSGKLEISPMAFTPFVMEHEIKRVLKKFGGE